MTGPPDAPRIAGPSGPDEARARLAEQLRAAGRLHGGPIEDAFRSVPRHLFLPGLPPAEAYRDDAIVIKYGAGGMPASSSSQPAIMAIMLEQLGLAAGHRVLEIGTGSGYNAAVMAHVVGPAGAVVTIDIDAELTEAARGRLRAAGFGGVCVRTGDGGFGVPEFAPYDRIIVTAGAWDLAPAWLAQLASGGRIVLPLSVRGVQLSAAFERDGACWTSQSACRCGFIKLAGAQAGPESVHPIGPQPGLVMLADDGRALDTLALHAALTGPAADAPTGIRLDAGVDVGDLELWLAVTESELARLTVVMTNAPRAVPPLLPGGGLLDDHEPLAVAAVVPHGDWQPAAPAPWLRRDPPGIAIRGFGPGGPALAERLAERARVWDSIGRPGTADLRLQACPAGTGRALLTGQVVLTKRDWLLGLSWPAHAGGPGAGYG